MFSDEETIGKLVIYRELGTIGLIAMSQPKLKLEGKVVGKCRRKDRVEVPLSAGTYKLTMQTDIVVSLNVTIKEGQTVWVACTMLPIGILLPAPSIRFVADAKVPKRARRLKVQ